MAARTSRQSIFCVLGSHSVSHSVGRSVSQSASQSDSQSGGLSVSQMVCQSNQSVSLVSLVSLVRQVKRLVRQTVSQYNQSVSLVGLVQQSVRASLVSQSVKRAALDCGLLNSVHKPGFLMIVAVCMVQGKTLTG